MAAAVSLEKMPVASLAVVNSLASVSAFVLAVTGRWIPSEANISDRPSRTYDPSDNRDRTVTDLLTTVVEKRRRRDVHDLRMIRVDTELKVLDSGAMIRRATEARRVRYLPRSSAAIAPLR